MNLKRSKGKKNNEILFAKKERKRKRKKIAARRKLLVNKIQIYFQKLVFAVIYERILMKFGFSGWGKSLVPNRVVFFPENSNGRYFRHFRVFRKNSDQQRYSAISPLQ